MKTILCYGDSNTYGYKPDGSGRYSEQQRWTCLLGQYLGSGCRVIEDGNVGRTTVFEDETRAGKNGITALPAALELTKPVDVVVLMLGTNDCKSFYSISADQIAYCVERLVEVIQRSHCGPNGDAPGVFIVSPILLGEKVHLPGFDPEFSAESVETAKGLKEVYRRVAQKYGCGFMAASEYAVPSEIDQEHMDEAEHKKLAAAIYRHLTEWMAEA